jgi:mannosyl-3-phosphoglycerate phosphatase
MPCGGDRRYGPKVTDSTDARIVVFSYMDAVLSNPQGARFSRSARALKRLTPYDAALVLCSGKTRAELQFIQQKLDIEHPCICENGGAVLIPDRYFGFDVPNVHSVAGYHAVEFGRPYAAIVDSLRRAASRLRLRIQGFSDMSIDDVARECRLPLLEARLAKLREYTEPFRVLDGSGDARARLFTALHAAGLRAVRGPFFDCASAPVDIDVGVNLLTMLYRRQSAQVLTIGLAPDETDHQLLPLVDRAVIAPADPNPEINLMDWTAAIVDAVESMRNRHPKAAWERPQPC